MAKKRTKKDRIKAAINRQKVQHNQLNLAGKVVEERAEKVVKKQQKDDDSIAQLFAYDPKLIIKDIKKTMLLVFFILVVLLALALIYT